MQNLKNKFNIKLYFNIVTFLRLVLLILLIIPSRSFASDFSIYSKDPSFSTAPATNILLCSDNYTFYKKKMEEFSLYFNLGSFSITELNSFISTDTKDNTTIAFVGNPFNKKSAECLRYSKSLKSLTITIIESLGIEGDDGNALSSKNNIKLEEFVCKMQNERSNKIKSIYSAVLLGINDCSNEAVANFFSYSR